MGHRARRSKRMHFFLRVALPLVGKKKARLISSWRTAVRVQFREGKKNGKSFLRLSGLLFPGLPSSAIPLIRQVAKGHAHPRARTVSHRRHQSTSTGRRAALCDRYGYTTTDGGRLIDSVFFAPVKISSSLQRARSIGAKEGKIKNRQLRRP